MIEHRESPPAQAARGPRGGQGVTALPADRGALARGGVWLRDGTAIRMPRRTRLALVHPQMLKAQASRPAGS